MLQQIVLKLLYGRLARTAIRHPRDFIKGEQVDLAPQAVHELDQAPGICQSIVHVTQQDILKGDALPHGEWKGPTGREQGGDGIGLVNRHDLCTHSVCRGIERYRQVHFQVSASKGLKTPDEARGRHSNAAWRNPQAPLSRENVYGLHCALKIVQWLP